MREVNSKKEGFQHSESFKKDLALANFEKDIDVVFDAYDEFKEKIKGLVIGPSVINSTGEMVEYCNNLQTLMLNDLEESSENIKKKKDAIVNAYYKRHRIDLVANGKSLGAIYRNNESADM